MNRFATPSRKGGNGFCESQAYEETRFEGPRPTYTEAEATKD